MQGPWQPARAQHGKQNHHAVSTACMVVVPQGPIKSRAPLHQVLYKTHMRHRAHLKELAV